MSAEQEQQEHQQPQQAHQKQQLLGEKLTSPVQQTAPTSKAPVLGEEREQWITNMKYPCVHCNAVFGSRPELLRHYDNTRHDKYSAFK